MPPHERPTRSKETGQWALGQRDPLNPNEYLLVASSTATPLPMITVRALTPP